MEAEPPSGRTPDRLATALADRYRIIRELGAGGMATVYLADDIKHDREVAVKVLRPELAAVLGQERFLNEIKISARLDHPHILTLIDSGTVEGALYYVVPYVRGDSLRARITNRGPLPLEDALRITTQLASALDYAHRQGVIHRDLKPENILFQEEMALLADFGIALALKEAGGHRLTETGLSLGTPQYMSPEQASGDKRLDARSDVYSLAAVLYEMLAGDPPHIGSSVQAMIAKLLTERPTKLRVLRNTVPEGVEAAVDKALAKVPADRYPSAGEFAAAVAAGAAGAAGGRPIRGRALARWIIVGALGVGALVGLGSWIAKVDGTTGRSHALVLRDRKPLTSTGRIGQLALSGDGKQLAYATRSCEASVCSGGVEVENVDGSAVRRVLESANYVDGIRWSPDRRYLLVSATIAGRYGPYLVSTLGGQPQLLPHWATDFFADGDSLLLSPAGGHDSIGWIRVAALDGVALDSIRVPDAGDGLGAQSVPGTRWIVVIVLRGPLVELRIIDRQGRERDRKQIGTSDLIIRVSRGAVWWSHGAASSDGRLVRCMLDTRRGRLSAVLDTVPLSGATSFDVSANGHLLVTNTVFNERDAYALDFRDLVRGALAPERRLRQHVTTPMRVNISPDGQRVALSQQRITVMPFAGGPETPVPTGGASADFNWVDSATLMLVERDSGDTHFVLIDATTGARRDELRISGSIRTFFDPFVANEGVTALSGGGWAWLAEDGQSIRVQQRGDSQPRVIQKPPWYRELYMIRSSPDGRRLAVVGFDSRADSVRLTVLSLADGAMAPWATTVVSYFVDYHWLADGSILWRVVTPDTDSYYRLRAPGQAETLAKFARARDIVYLTTSRDLKRVALMTMESHGDAWMWTVGN